jgi:hypothetical protein
MKPKKRSLVIGNTKLITGRTEDVSFMQGYLALRIMKNFILERFGVQRKRNRDEEPDLSEILDSVGVVLAGDLNRYPNDALYQFFSKGGIDKDTVAAAFGRKIPDRPLTHDFQGLRSAYEAATGSEPILTTKTGCLDYIWFTSSSLLPRSVLSTPTSLPREVTAANPSDHVPLKATFSFIDPGPATSEKIFDPSKRPAPIIDPVAATVQSYMKKEAASSGSPRRDAAVAQNAPIRRPVVTTTFFDRKKLTQLNRRVDADDVVAAAAVSARESGDSEPSLPRRSKK